MPVPKFLDRSFLWELDKGSFNVVRAYLDEGNDPNTVPRFFWSEKNWKDWENEEMPILSIAAIRGHTDIVEMLLIRGAKVDLMDRHLRTPLWLAAKYLQLDAVKLLVKYGAYINAGDKYERTAFEEVGRSRCSTAQWEEMYDYLASQGGKRWVDMDKKEKSIHLNRQYLKLQMNINDRCL